MAKRKFEKAFGEEATHSYTSYNNNENLQKLVDRYRDALIPSKIEELSNSLLFLRHSRPFVETVKSEKTDQLLEHLRKTNSKENEAQLESILEVAKKESNDLLLMCTALSLWADSRVYIQLYSKTETEDETLDKLEEVGRAKFHEGKETALMLRRRITRHYRKRSALVGNWECSGTIHAWKAAVECDEIWKDVALSQAIELIRTYLEVLHVLKGIHELDSCYQRESASENGGIFAKLARFIKNLV